MSIEAMKLALEALEEINKLSIGESAICLPAEIDTAMDALRQAIEQPEQAQPVAEVKLKERGGNAGLATVIHEIYDPMREPLRVGNRLFAAPPPRQSWAGLTNEDMYEIGEFKNTHGYVPTGFKRLAAAIEAKLKEKNT